MFKLMVQRFWFIMVYLFLCYQMKQGIIVKEKGGSSQKTCQKEGKGERERNGRVW